MYIYSVYEYTYYIYIYIHNYIIIHIYIYNIIYIFIYIRIYYIIDVNNYIFTRIYRRRSVCMLQWAAYIAGGPKVAEKPCLFMHVKPVL